MHLRLESENRRSRGIVRICILVLVSIPGCQRQMPSGLKLDAHVLPEPPRVGPADVQILLLDSANNTVSGARISVEADMAHPGMKPLFATASAGGNEYHARLNFDMPGDWVLVVRANTPEGERVEQQIQLTVRE